ncbi:hypothetical protein GmHk_14G041130 [Glycine max]|nr:hypothetical protein GmHk_14G041130 [Glycine max]
MSGTGSGNGSNSSNANTGTSTGAASRSKNAPGNRTDIGWKHGTDVLGNVLEEVKMLMMNIVAEVANASEKRRKLNIIHEEGTEGVEVESNSSQSGIQRKGMLAFKGRRKAKFVQASGAFAKFCDMVGRYGVGYKPPSYHDIREKLLKRAVAKTDVMLQEFRDEWKKTVDFVGEENVVQVITDNAANYKAAKEL